MQHFVVTFLMLVLLSTVLSSPVVDIIRPLETEREEVTAGTPRPALPEGNSDENEVAPGRPTGSAATSSPSVTSTTEAPGTDTRRNQFPVINLFPGSFPSMFGADDEDDFGDGLFLNFNPFSTFSMQNAFRRMENMMREAEERMRRIFQSSLNATSQYPEDYNNSTSDIIEVNGQKYKLQRTVTKKGNNESSVFVTFTTLTPVNRRKREVDALPINSFAEELHRLKREATFDFEE